MRKSLLFATTCVWRCFVAKAQINIPASGTVSDSFNALDTNGAASLPTGWKISSAGTVADGRTVGSVLTLSHSPSTCIPTTGGRYNCGTSATNRAIGFMTDRSFIRLNTFSE